jgi:uncharacterized protein YbaR (Trm112 family)
MHGLRESPYPALIFTMDFFTVQIVRLSFFTGGTMGDIHTSARNVNIDKDLLAILCCPDTKQDVSVAADALIQRLNERIAKGELKNKAGQVVAENLDGGLLRADKKILYPVREDIPVMLIEEGIPLEGII